MINNSPEEAQEKHDYSRCGCENETNGNGHTDRCKKVYLGPGSSDWKEKERDVFENSGILTFLDGAKVSLEPESVFNWHISRAEKLIEQSYARGRADEIKRNIELNER